MDAQEMAQALDVQVSVDDLLLRYAKITLERDGLRERCRQLLEANDALVRASNAPAEMPSPIRPLSDEAFRDEEAVSG